MKIRLSSAQIFVIEELGKKGEIELSQINSRTVKKLVELKMVWYNDKYDGVLLTEFGKKTYETI